jgi:hypothetical protein
MPKLTDGEPVDMIPITKEPDHCDCADRGIPEGYLCGKPECHRTIAANKALSQLGETIKKYAEECGVDLNNPPPFTIK